MDALEMQEKHLAKIAKLERIIYNLYADLQDAKEENKNLQEQVEDWQEQADYWEIMYMTEQGNRKIAEKVARKYKAAYDRLVDEMLK